jgi:hypothetical protein
MTDAANQLDLPRRVEVGDVAETQATDAALSRLRGGTGASVSTVADLLTHLGRGAASGFAPLDSGVLVPIAYLPTMVAPSGSSTDGERGVVPAPLKDDTGTRTYEQYRALRGDATWTDRVHLAQVLCDDASTPVVTFNTPNTPANSDSYGYLRTMAAGSRRYRLGSNANPGSGGDANVDLQLETAGYGEVTHEGDRFATSIKPLRAITAVPFGSTFTTVGLATATVASPGAAATNFEDADGCYVSLTNDATLDVAAGVSVASACQRRHDPSLIVAFRSALTQSRLWIGLFSATPSGSDTLGTTQGAGIRFTQGVDTSPTNYRFVTCDGTTQTTTATDKAATADEFTVLRVRHVGSGTWEFANWNPSNSTWENFLEQSGGPATSTTLGIYVLLDDVSSASNRAIRVKTINLFSE